MAQIYVKCPNCGSIDVIKHGKSSSGIQRYACKNSECKTKSFQFEHIYNAYEPDTEEKIITMAANSSGIRDTARVLKISPYKVIPLQ